LDGDSKHSIDLRNYAPADSIGAAAKEVSGDFEEIAASSAVRMRWHTERKATRGTEGSFKNIQLTRRLSTIAHRAGGGCFAD
jgi:hypothetical protein